MTSNASAAISNAKPFIAEQHWVAIVGRRDYPVDGIVDYCELLGRALAPRGIEVETLHVDWPKEDWLVSLRNLAKLRPTQDGDWAILQYTALAWSRRGFPFPALGVLRILRRNGFRCAVMFHEPYGLVRRQSSINRIRGVIQDWVVEKLHRQADKSIFADPFHTIPWLREGDKKSAFISIGSNMPERLSPRDESLRKSDEGQIAIFCLTEPPHVEQELRDIAAALRVVNGQGVCPRVLFIGRGTQEARSRIEDLFRDLDSPYTIAGMRSREEISDALAGCEAMLCVRGRLFPRRGSAIAGVACGLPLIGYGGHIEETPLAEAGVMLVPYGDTDALGKALVQVLRDAELRCRLREKSIRAQRRYYSWDRIAPAYVEFLGGAGRSDPQNAS